MERDGERFSVDIVIKSDDTGDVLYSTCSTVSDLSAALADLHNALEAVRTAMGLE